MKLEDAMTNLLGLTRDQGKDATVNTMCRAPVDFSKKKASAIRRRLPLSQHRCGSPAGAAVRLRWCVQPMRHAAQGSARSGITFRAIDSSPFATGHLQSARVVFLHLLHTSPWLLPFPPRVAPKGARGGRLARFAVPAQHTESVAAWTAATNE